MGVNDLMILDLETLQEMTGEIGRIKRPATETDEASVSLQTETIPDLAKITEEVAEKPSSPLPQRKKRQFTLREEAPEPKHNANRMPIARYGGAGVYSMPVRYSGDGKFEKGRDHPYANDPTHKPLVIETSEFELENVENEIRRRRRRRRLDDE